MHACTISPLNTLPDYRVVVIFTFHKNKLILSRHKKRSTWETQGGHIEPGEIPVDAARRELWEESGAETFTLTPLLDYSAGNGICQANAQAFLAQVEHFSLFSSRLISRRLFPSPCIRSMLSCSFVLR